MTHRYFFYLLILFLPTQLGYHFWPEWTTVLGRQIDYLSPTLYLTDILVLCTLIFWFWEKRNRIVYRVSRIPYAVYGILIIILCNIFGSLRSHVAVYGWLKILEYGLLVLYIRKTKPSVSRVSWFLSLAILYSSVIAISQFFLQHSIGGLMWYLGERTFNSGTPGIALFSWCQSLNASGCQLLMRAYATFPHPNVLGGFLAVTIPYILGVVASGAKQSVERLPRPRLSSGLAMTAVFMGTIALVLTFSRSAWVIFLLGMLLLKKRNIAVYISVFMLMMIIAGTFHPMDESVVVRQQLISSSIEIWKMHPWFGVGLGNFLVSLPSFVPSTFIYFLQPVHNIYLLLISEFGLIGVIGLIILIWKSKIYQKLNWHIIAVLLLGLVDHYPLTLQQGQLLLTLLIGLLF